MIDLMALIESVPGIGPYLPWLPILFGICAVVAAQMPPPASGSGFYGVAYGVINLLAHNYRHAANASAPPAQPPAPPSVGAVLALLLLVGVTVGLAACSPAQEARALGMAQVFCLMDGVAQPMLVAQVPDNIARTDAVLVHPAVVAACAAVHGEPSSVQVAPVVVP